ncbi:hypothetical protein V501_08638 [Pseudogymnoascus sp. VKM F-4519 (FW-2642)]|nr:hypothetical protein V501_08638 [Pseudogymnoascus sp. VKM F-4519 (FW-2642)]
MAADRLLGAAPVACVSCRRLKMRCIGAANPPCARCLKSNRECMVQLPNRQQRHLPPSSSNAVTSPNPLVEHTPSPGVSHESASPAVRTEAASQLQEPSTGLASEQRNPLLYQTSLPSIFSSSPITIASTMASKSDSPSGGVPASHTRLELDQVSHSTILDLVEFFLQKMICYTPVLSLEQLDNPESLISSRRPLAYAMAFVASTHSPGYTSTRLALLPHMLKMLKEPHDAIDNTQNENWTLLQALAVLYAYPRVAAVSKQDREKQMSPWAVKSAVETCAMQVSLHQSVEDLKALIESREPDILSSLPYRCAFFWLWLFVKSRHHSVLTRTPPTIPYDQTIASTLDLIMNLDPSPGVWRVLAEAALHHKWDQAARLDKSLPEWWGVLPDIKDGGALPELLENVENLLQEWHSEWLPPTEISSPSRSSVASNFQDPSIFANSITAFMGILTRFNIVSFATPIISHQLVTKTGLGVFPSMTAQSPELSAFLNCVLKSADAAATCCDSILDLKPVAREQLRYMPDYGFTMLALCCLHLVYADNISPENSTLRSYLMKAERVASLMMDLSVGCNVCPKIYGEYVSFQLRNAPHSSTHTFHNCNADQIMAESQRLSVRGHEDSHSWPQLGPTGSNYPPLDYLLDIGPMNGYWPAIELNSDGALPLNSELFNMFNT